MERTTTSPQVAPVAGARGLPKVVVTAADGARVEAYLHGAHVTSWHAAGDEDERLFVSAASEWVEGVAIRGGIPVCFPQFADQGPLPMHGLVRKTSWALVEAGNTPDGAARARFRFVDSDATRARWPHAFACEIDVTASGRALTVALTVTNTGSQPFAFTGALHTYLRMDDATRGVVHGLAGARYRDKVLGHDDDGQTDALLHVDRPLDRVYRAVPDHLVVEDGRRRIEVHAEGTSDTVIWNPGPWAGAKIGDLDRDDWRAFLCVEAAVASAPVSLLPGGARSLSQTLRLT